MLPGARRCDMSHQTGIQGTRTAVPTGTAGLLPAFAPASRVAGGRSAFPCWSGRGVEAGGRFNGPLPAEFCPLARSLFAAGGARPLRRGVAGRRGGELRGGELLLAQAPSRDRSSGSQAETCGVHSHGCQRLRAAGSPPEGSIACREPHMGRRPPLAQVTSLAQAVLRRWWGELGLRGLPGYLPPLSEWPQRFGMGCTAREMPRVTARPL